MSSTRMPAFALWPLVMRSTDNLCSDETHRCMKSKSLRRTGTQLTRQSWLWGCMMVQFSFTTSARERRNLSTRLLSELLRADEHLARPGTSFRNFSTACGCLDAQREPRSTVRTNKHTDPVWEADALTRNLHLTCALYARPLGHEQV